MSGRRRGWLLGGWLLTAALLVAGCGGGSGHPGSSDSTSTSSSVTNGSTSTTTTVAPGPQGVGIHKIRHVVIIMQENRSFDTYFGTYPGADGIPGLAGNPGTVPCVPDPLRGGCVRPFHDRNDRSLGGPHSAAASAADINGGKMDGFVSQQEHGMAGCAQTFNPACGNGERHAGRDGLPHRRGHPELLGLRARFRAPGPHVRVGGVVEPASTPVHGVRVVRLLLDPKRSEELSQRDREPPESAGLRAPARQPPPDQSELRLDRPDLAAAQGRCQLGLLRRRGEPARLRRQRRDVVRAGRPDR